MNYCRDRQFLHIETRPFRPFSLVSCSVLGVSNTFDVLDRVTGITWQDSPNSVVRNFAYAYNAVGMITNVVREDSSHTEYTYDSLDRLISETSVGSVTSMVQDERGRVSIYNK